MDRGNVSPKGSDPFETFCHPVTQRWGRGYVDERREGRRESQGGGFGVKVRRGGGIFGVWICLCAGAGGGARPPPTAPAWARRPPPVSPRPTKRAPCASPRP